MFPRWPLCNPQLSTSISPGICPFAIPSLHRRPSAPPSCSRLGTPKHPRESLAPSARPPSGCSPARPGLSETHRLAHRQEVIQQQQVCPPGMVTVVQMELSHFPDGSPGCKGEHSHQQAHGVHVKGLQPSRKKRKWGDSKQGPRR